MAINPIEGISAVQNIAKADSTQKSESSFSNILSEAIDYIEATEAEAEAATEAVLTGESDDIHTAMIASQKAELAVSYAVEIRNRLIEAYNNIMEMQV